MPAEERKIEIERKVNEIIYSNQLNKPGFDLISFLISKENFKVGMQKLERGTSGLILVNEDEIIEQAEAHRLIVINSRLKLEPDFLLRRRFITAHEYGHFMLHNEGGHIFAHREDSERNSVLEREADFFARCLLMPRQLVDEALKLWGLEKASVDDKVKFIADTFKVTEKKARQRLTEDFV